MGINGWWSVISSVNPNTYCLFLLVILAEMEWRKEGEKKGRVKLLRLNFLPREMLYIDLCHCVNDVIAGCTCVNKLKLAMWVTTWIHVHCEIIYTPPTADTGSLTGGQSSIWNLGSRYGQSRRLSARHPVGHTLAPGRKAEEAKM